MQIETHKKKLLAPLEYIPAEVACAADYEHLADQFIPSDYLAYISGGSGLDITLQNNRIAFSRFSLLPRPFREVDDGNTSLQLLGRALEHPVILAPLAYQTLVHPEGEIATARAAEATSTCMIASTLSSFTMEDIASVCGTERWFQLYFQPRDEDTLALVERAVRGGYQAVIVTVDAAVQAPSLRAVRAGFRLPDDVTPANIAQQKPLLRKSTGTAQSTVFTGYSQNVSTLEKLARLINQCPVPVLVKGILHPGDALEMQALGAAGIVVSNHGGRTLDDSPSSLAVLPGIRKAVGRDYPVLFDSGIRSGADIFKAIALGSDAALVGRLQVYALSVAGALGVAHLLKLLRQELELCMAMTGCASIADIKATELHINSEK